MPDWMVRVYASDHDADELYNWVIEDRTEAEASAEAAADIAAEFSFAGDWTLTQVGAES